jgi:hypothetical protein
MGEQENTYGSDPLLGGFRGGFILRTNGER